MGYCGFNVWSTTLDTDSPSWLYGSRIGLAFGYCLYDNNDKPYITKIHFQVYIHPPYANNSFLLMKKASSLIQFDAWVCIVATNC
jgi:hypothetical protein